MTIAFIVYSLCALASAAVAFLLLRGWSRTRASLLLWSGLCFVGFFLNAVMLTVGYQIGHELSVVRSIPTLLGLAVLLYGLVWRSGER